MSTLRTQTALAVIMLTLFCQWTLIQCKSIDAGPDLEALNDAVETMATAKKSHQDYGYSKRYLSSSQDILNQCYSGDLKETVEALGVLNITGVNLVQVEGALYESLLKNGTVVVKNSSERDDVSKVKSIVKRTQIDMCEEEFDFTYFLADANGQLAYQVDTVRCQGNTCQWPMSGGDCVLRKKSMVVYVVDSNGVFMPQTIEIGCACECLIQV